MVGTFSLFCEDKVREVFEEMRARLCGDDFEQSGEMIFDRSRLSQELEKLKEVVVKLRERESTMSSIALNRIFPEQSILRNLSKEKVAQIICSLGLDYEGGLIKLPGEPGLAPEAMRIKRRILSRFSGPISAYPTLEILKRDFPTARKLIAMMLSSGELIHLGGGVLVKPQDYEKWAKIIISELNKRDKLFLPEIKNLLGLSRKYLIPFLEGLDRLGITEREGNFRKRGRRFKQAESLISHKLSPKK